MSLKLIAGTKDNSVREIEIRLIENNGDIDISAYSGGKEVRCGHIGSLQVAGNTIRLTLFPSLNTELFCTVPGGYIEVAKC